MTTALLNGILEEDLYMKQLDGFDQENGLVYKLYKSLYGLKQSSNCWNKHFNNFICQQGLTKSKSDQYDVLVAGNSMKKVNNLRKLLSDEFKLTDQGDARSFLGIKIERHNNILKMNQAKYLENLLHNFGMNKCKPILTPMEKKLKFGEKGSTTLSSTEAEYIALASAIQERMWLKELLVEMGIIKDKDYILLHEDNQSCIKIANEPKKHQRLKHLDTKYNFIHEAISTNQIKLEYVQIDHQLADILTKPLPAILFSKLRKAIGLVEQLILF
ncbi:Reverse transcriptase, RNA-dependent DNA polymerase [Cinara cedri]|uniref:Reverse transcriptase, RNA-dependent DNA polymerase n=1 Tax=Cinara cedri TaxID=506608 RepID=A0A5E4N2B6_9HEMI|nr:Reverse transcriptase, RNA-dependent DNA polymerase [Cinara cedri]